MRASESRPRTSSYVAASWKGKGVSKTDAGLPCVSVRALPYSSPDSRWRILDLCHRLGPAENSSPPAVVAGPGAPSRWESHSSSSAVSILPSAPTRSSLIAL